MLTIALKSAESLQRLQSTTRKFLFQINIPLITGNQLTEDFAYAAMLIWKSLEKGLSARAIADEIVRSYEVTPEAALQNVEKAVKDFETYKLIGVR
jgi:hypothetical protein